MHNRHPIRQAAIAYLTPSHSNQTNTQLSTTRPLSPTVQPIIPSTMVYHRGRSKSLESEDEKVKQLRAKIQKIQHADCTFENRGQDLYSLVTESHRNAIQASEDAAASIISCTRLPCEDKFQPRLTGLPVELVENIAIRLPLEDLANLRLSCNTLKVKIGYHFAKKYFTSRVVKPEWDSIRRLIIIMNNPEFGSVVRDIAVDTCPRSPFNPTPTFQRPNYGVPVYRRRLHQDSLPPNVFDLHNLSSLLSRLFDKIPRLRSLNFRVFGSSIDTPQTRLSGGRECSVDILESALNALVSSGRHINSLSLGNYDSDCFFHLPSLNVNKLAASATLASIFKNITTLELAFLTSPDDISDIPSSLLNMTPKRSKPHRLLQEYRR